MQQKALILFIGGRGLYILIRLSWYHHHLPRAGASAGSFLTLRKGVNRDTITGASRSQLLHLDKRGFTGWLKGVTEKRRRQHLQQMYCSLNAGKSLNLSLSLPYLMFLV